MNLALTKGVQLKYQPPDPEAWGGVVLGGGTALAQSSGWGAPPPPPRQPVSPRLALKGAVPSPSLSLGLGGAGARRPSLCSGSS